MERKIGEIFEIDGEWYQCVEAENPGTYDCSECDFFGEYGCVGLACIPGARNDGKDIVFRKLEKVGKLHRFGKKLMQPYKLFAKPVVPHELGYFVIYSEKNKTIEIEIKQNEEDMKEKIQHYDCFFDKKESNLKPFDLEAAKAGKPVCTRDGRKARIICYDRQSDHGFPLVALVENPGAEKDEDVRCYRSSGIAADPGDTLMMLPEKKEGWAKVRKDINLYDTKEEADRKMIGNDEYVTAKVFWEE